MIKSYILLFIYLILCIVVGVLVTLLSPNRCISNKCYRKALLMSTNIDPNTKPCDNFFKHVCNNYKGVHVRNLHLDKGSLEQDLEQIQIRYLISFLSKPAKKKDDRILRVLKMIYQTCMNVDLIEEEGYRPLLRHIEISLGFPLTEGTRWNDRLAGLDWSFESVEFNTIYSGFIGGHLIKIEVHGVGYQSSVKYVHVSQPAARGFNRTQREAYIAYLNKVSSLLNSTNSKEREEDINDLLKFRRQVESIINKVRNCSERTVQESLEEFSNEFNFIGLNKFLKEMILYIPVPKTILITLSSRQYLSALKLLMEKTANRTKSNYMMFHNIMEVSTYLPKKAREAYHNFVSKIGDPNKVIEVSRKYLCVKSIQSKMSSALSALYLRNVIKEYPQPKGLENMMAWLKEETKVTVEGLRWMDKSTKVQAIKKIDAMELVTPVPKDVFDDLTNVTAFRLYYEDLCFIGNTTSTLSAYLALQQFKTNKNWELLERPEQVFDENINIFSCKVQYDYNRNAVIVPMAFFRYPTYDKMWPFYLNFGGLASEIATGMIRGIDVSGSTVNATGGKENWWSSRTRAKYRNYTSCYLKKYNAYLKQHVSGKLKDPACLGEAIARTAGVKIAYHAYISYKRQRTFPERTLYGYSHYSPKQMFFFDFATFHCNENASSYRENESEQRMARLSPEYKVIGPLRNNLHFAQDFQCSLDDFMNPTEKCYIWMK